MRKARKASGRSLYLCGGQLGGQGRYVEEDAGLLVHQGGGHGVGHLVDMVDIEDIVDILY